MVIYKVTNLINGKIYIGQTTRSIRKRWSEHINVARGNRKNQPIHLAIKKYGKDSFYIEVVKVAANQIELNNLEEYYIEYYNALAPSGYNLKKQSEGRGPQHEQTKKKLSKILTKKPVIAIDLYTKKVKHLLNSASWGKNNQSRIWQCCINFVGRNSFREHIFAFEEDIGFNLIDAEILEKLQSKIERALNPLPSGKPPQSAIGVHKFNTKDVIRLLNMSAGEPQWPQNKISEVVNGIVTSYKNYVWFVVEDHNADVTEEQLKYIELVRNKHQRAAMGIHKYTKEVIKVCPLNSDSRFDGSEIARCCNYDKNSITHKDYFWFYIDSLDEEPTQRHYDFIESHQFETDRPVTATNINTGEEFYLSNMKVDSRFEPAKIRRCCMGHPKQKSHLGHTFRFAN